MFDDQLLQTVNTNYFYDYYPNSNDWRTIDKLKEILRTQINWTDGTNMKIEDIFVSLDQKTNKLIKPENKYIEQFLISGFNYNHHLYFSKREIKQPNIISNNVIYVSKKNTSSTQNSQLYTIIFELETKTFELKTQNSEFLNNKLNSYFVNNVLNTINTNFSLSQKINTPTLITVGSQSSGKSTILNRILNLNIIPVGSVMETRTPINIELINTKQDYYVEFGEYEHGQWCSIKKIYIINDEPTLLNMNDIKHKIIYVATEWE